MLADVVELRRLGVRLPTDTVRMLRPIRGILTLRPRYQGLQGTRRNASLMAGLAAEGDMRWVFAPLDEARVSLIENRGILITGMQETGSREKDLVTHRQTWWARLVVPKPRRSYDAFEGDDDPGSQPHRYGVEV